MRAIIREEIERIEPLDALEQATKINVLAWIDSDAEICRIAKPAIPPKHLISYFALVDGDHILLVDHINAELWLPTGGHVEVGEHPRTTALREAKEKLSAFRPGTLAQASRISGITPADVTVIQIHLRKYYGSEIRLSK